MTAIAMPRMFPIPTLRRVRRDEVARQESPKVDSYAQLMACWLDYMRLDDRDLGLTRMRLASDAAKDLDVYDSQRAADIKIGEAVNAMVESLPMRLRWAILKSQGISTAWRFPNADFSAVLSEARDELEQKLRKNGVTRLYYV